MLTIAQFQDAEDALQGSSGDETYENAIIDTYDSIVEDPSASLIFSSSPSATISLAHLHPPPVQIFKLWQTFLDNVNPLTKIFHAPTIQLRILEASADLENIPKGLEALMFGIYATAVMSMGHSEWDVNFGEMGEARQIALTRYRKAAKLALSRAGLLRSSDMTILQAFVLYLVSRDKSRLRGSSCIYNLLSYATRLFGFPSFVGVVLLPPFPLLYWYLIKHPDLLAQLHNGPPITFLPHGDRRSYCSTYGPKLRRYILRPFSLRDRTTSPSLVANHAPGLPRC